MQDRLVISGTAQLNGNLALNFGNGYAPRQGDVLTFVTASGATGSFGKLTISGLAPGFQYRINTAGGALTLTALNDGVPITKPAFAAFLPLIRR